MNSINPVSPLGNKNNIGKLSGVKPDQKNQPSFKSTLDGFMSDVNKMQLKADESMEKLVAGEITDVHEVMSSMQEANMAFNMMMEIRNKVLDAYQEVMRMRL